jgi:hypothetical protein
MRRGGGDEEIRTRCRQAAAGHHRGGQRQVGGAAGDSGFDGKAARGLIGLGVVGHVLRSRRFYERAIVGAIVLGALRGLVQENRVSAFERLAAWNKRQIQRLERQAERQARRLERKARRLERKAKRQARRLAVWAKLRIRGSRTGQPTAS